MITDERYELRLQKALFLETSNGIDSEGIRATPKEKENLEGMEKFLEHYQREKKKEVGGESGTS